MAKLNFFKYFFKIVNVFTVFAKFCWTVLFIYLFILHKVSDLGLWLLLSMVLNPILHVK